jgi:hypothetical protein
MGLRRIARPTVLSWTATCRPGFAACRNPADDVLRGPCGCADPRFTVDEPPGHVMRLPAAVIGLS